MSKTAAKAPKAEEKATTNGAIKAVNAATKAENTIAEKLKELYLLQTIDSRIDKLRTVRGELPLEVQDLEDEVAGLETRLVKIQDELKDMETQVTDKQNAIKDSKAQIKKYEGQQAKVRNNREFDSLGKEIEFQNLEIQLAEKRIKEAKFGIESKQAVVTESTKLFKERKKDLDLKKKELDDIISETEKDEKDLQKRSKTAASHIEERLLNAYHRIRSNARNGLAVVAVERGSCGGCYNSIPPQRQLDISSHKKIIVCEHCGRVLVDEAIASEVKAMK
ncbi:MAG: hypothetical protein IPG74_12370 [Flavobacteriales bacterium]|nr:hypothetical protein [Flavobacteriales bacterium]MBK7556660.1 hypothetical protein [Flavobacteriales bacterium]MBK9193950.1 hypothetical protein [Flavobacteriales bacterium]MBP6574516.1 hypothetical protein [Flavobacteriales bacterium]